MVLSKDVFINLISLSLQNTDGGFATYELTRSYSWLEVAFFHYLVCSHLFKVYLL